MKNILAVLILVCLVGLLSYTKAEAAMGTKTEKNGLSCAGIVHMVDDQEARDPTIKLNNVLKVNFVDVKGLTVENDKIYPGLAIDVLSLQEQKVVSADNGFANIAQKGLAKIFAGTITATIRTGAPMEDGQTYTLKLRLFDTKGRGEILYETTLVISGENKKESVPSKGQIVSSGLEVERTALASKNKEVQFDAFSIGDTVQFVLVNVKGLEKGADGLYAFDMDLSVIEPSGSILFEKKDLLGDGGHLALTDGLLKTPIVTIDTVDYKPGKYTATVKIYDKNSTKSAQATRSFGLFNIGKK